MLQHVHLVYGTTFKLRKLSSPYAKLREFNRKAVCLITWMCRTSLKNVDSVPPNFENNSRHLTQEPCADAGLF